LSCGFAVVGELCWSYGRGSGADIGSTQVHMADPHVRIDRPLRDAAPARWGPAVHSLRGEMRAVIRELAKRNARVNEAADGLRELRLRGEVERDVMQPRDVVRLRRPVG
jgi:hypothetical protein